MMETELRRRWTRVGALAVRETRGRRRLPPLLAPRAATRRNTDPR